MIAVEKEKTVRGRSLFGRLKIGHKYTEKPAVDTLGSKESYRF